MFKMQDTLCSLSNISNQRGHSSHLSIPICLLGHTVGTNRRRLSGISLKKERRNALAGKNLQSVPYHIRLSSSFNAKIKT